MPCGTSHWHAAAGHWGHSHRPGRGAPIDGNIRSAGGSENVVWNSYPPLRRVLGVAIRAFDAWMLTDERAVTRVLGYVVPMQHSPEEKSDAKSMCALLLRQSQAAMSQSEF